ncbi:hypothetical protein F2Q68_00032972 [Brassica cretica]|uniref:Uncharacterized protein n=1 Tax=Brassica cretica TaxID=69181 RepID=A0A8S9G4Y1_BRACR|nr:hypothetical protein F2Q68_00032972 [Brassica cretica]
MISGSTCDKRRKLGSSGGYRCLGARLLFTVQECEAGVSEERVESDQLEICKRSL